MPDSPTPAGAAPRDEAPPERVWLVAEDAANEGLLYWAVHPDWCGKGEYAHLRPFPAVEYIRADVAAAPRADPDEAAARDGVFAAFRRHYGNAFDRAYGGCGLNDALDTYRDAVRAAARAPGSEP